MTRAGERSERGAVTVEFAVVLPLVATLLAGALAAVLVVDADGRLVAAAGAAARAHGRGDPGAAARAVAAIAPGATATVSRSGGIVCARAARTVRIGVLPAVGTSETVCAADGGR